MKDVLWKPVVQLLAGMLAIALAIRLTWELLAPALLPVSVIALVWPCSSSPTSAASHAAPGPRARCRFHTRKSLDRRAKSTHNDE